MSAGRPMVSIQAMTELARLLAELGFSVQTTRATAGAVEVYDAEDTAEPGTDSATTGRAGASEARRTKTARGRRSALRTAAGGGPAFERKRTRGSR